MPKPIALYPVKGVPALNKLALEPEFFAKDRINDFFNCSALKFPHGLDKEVNFSDYSLLCLSKSL